MNKHTLSNFNILAESIINEGLFTSKNWTLREEFDAILPSIEKKVKLAFEHLPKSIDRNDEFEIGGNDIIPIDEGTQTPGFLVTWSIPLTYAKNVIINILQQNGNRHIGSFQVTGNTMLAMKLNVADSGEIDLSTPDVKFKRMSIPKWSGNLYISSGKSNRINLGTVKCDCKVIAPTLLKNLNDSTKQNSSAGEFLGGLINGIKKTLKEKHDGGFEQIKVKGVSGKVEVKCIVSLTKLKLSDEATEKKNDESSFDGDTVSNHNSFDHNAKNIENIIDDITDDVKVLGKPAVSKMASLKMDLDYIISEIGEAINTDSNLPGKLCGSKSWRFVKRTDKTDIKELGDVIPDKTSIFEDANPDNSNGSGEISFSFITKVQRNEDASVSPIQKYYRVYFDTIKLSKAIKSGKSINLAELLWNNNTSPTILVKLVSQRTVLFAYKIDKHGMNKVCPEFEDFIIDYLKQVEL